MSINTYFVNRLTRSKFELFEYYPEFYIRLFKECFPDLPILPNTSNDNFHLDENEKLISQQIHESLKDSYLPLSLSEVFDRINLSAFGNSSTEIFFRAIQSAKFNLIQGDKPNELFIELREQTFQ